MCIASVHAPSSSYLEGCDNLLAHNGTQGVVARTACALPSKVINDVLASSNVTSHTTEALGEGSHHDIHVGSVDAGVLGASTACASHCSDRMSFVQGLVSCALMRAKRDSK